jgi:hypothetical protein
MNYYGLINDIKNLRSSLTPSRPYDTAGLLLFPSWIKRTPLGLT